jgi:SAM-dependent methyltransferase
MEPKQSNKTIRDFGDQWAIHGQLDQDYWTSKEMFIDHFGSLFSSSEISGKRIADIGSGSGRILQMISLFNPKFLYGIEPSHGFSILQQNTRNIPNLELINTRGEDFKVEDLDLVISFGVIHHIENPQKTLVNAYHNLCEGGRLIIWVYGYEGHELYVLFQKLFRPMIRLLPDQALNVLSSVLSRAAALYYQILTRLHFNGFPLKDYLEKVFIPCGKTQRKYITFDQLNPSYAKYYKESEVIKLLTDAGFNRVNTFHRHGYSWTAIGTKTTA